MVAFLAVLFRDFRKLPSHESSFKIQLRWKPKKLLTVVAEPSNRSLNIMHRKKEKWLKNSNLFHAVAWFRESERRQKRVLRKCFAIVLVENEVRRRCESKMVDVSACWWDFHRCRLKKQHQPAKETLLSLTKIIWAVSSCSNAMWWSEGKRYRKYVINNISKEMLSVAR